MTRYKVLLISLAIGTVIALAGLWWGLVSLPGVQ